MGSLFHGGSRNKPRYERLPLDTFFPPGSTTTRRPVPDDGQDEDNLLFDLESQGGQNGRLLSSARNGYDSEEEIEFYKDSRRPRHRGTRPPSSCCCLVCLLVVLMVAVLLFSALYLIRPRANATAGLGWTSDAYAYGTESAIRLYDVNQDGIEDVILGAAVTTSLQDIENEDEFCKKRDLKFPCAGLIMALDGGNGTRLWTIQTRVEVFAIQCGKLDINRDGHMDCVAAGRMATLHGIDPIKGVILWSADPSITNPHFNFYQGQVVPDLDLDGVPELVVTHGGDTRFSETELDRPAGRLLLLSGKTGRSLGRDLTLPDGHETYSAVTLYTRPSGAVYLLFGSGGETIAGSLWTISLRDLYCHVMSVAKCSADDLSNVTPLQNKGYGESWGTPIQTLPSGAKEIIRSGSSKGVTVPTELVDMNNDGVEDLVVFMYNSTLVVLDGVNLGVIWSTGSQFAQFETYSNPAPGYFNDDDTVDLMVRLSKGRWPSFTSTYIYILDGRNGEILWHLRTPSLSPFMSSPLTLRSHGQRDAFLFWAKGLGVESGAGGLEPLGHETGPEGDVGPSAPPGRPRRHGDGAGPDQPCLVSMDAFRADLLLVDRDLSLKPLRLASIGAFKYNYSLTDEDRLLLKGSDDQELGTVETVPPDDVHGTPPRGSAPQTTGAMATEEDLARHNLHAHGTVSTDVVSADVVTTVTAAVLLPGGPEPTSIAVTEVAELPEGPESTTTSHTSPEGQETWAAGTTESITETTLEERTLPVNVSKVPRMNSTSTIVSNTETAQPTDTDRSDTTAKTDARVSEESTTSELTNTPTEEVTTTPVIDLSTNWLEATTGGPQTTTSTSQPDVTSSASTLGLETTASTIKFGGPPADNSSSPQVINSGIPQTVTPSSPQAVDSSGPPTVDSSGPPADNSSSPQIINSGISQTVTPSSPQAVDSSGPPTVDSSGPPADNSSSPQIINSGIPQTVTSGSPQAVDSSGPHSVNSSGPPTVDSSGSQSVNPAFNLNNTGGSNNKSNTDTNEPTLLPKNQGIVPGAVEPTDEVGSTGLVMTQKAEITVNGHRAQTLAELFTEQGMMADVETSTPPPSEPAFQQPGAMSSGPEGDKSPRRRRRETPGGDLCTVYEPSLYGTGIIGDLDDDGNLDYVYVEAQMAELTDEDSRYLTTKLRLRVHRLDLKSAIQRRDWVRLGEDQVMLSEGQPRDEVDAEELEEHFRFLPADEQSWTAYMGDNGDEIFRKSKR